MGNTTINYYEIAKKKTMCQNLKTINVKKCVSYSSLLRNLIIKSSKINE